MKKLINITMLLILFVGCKTIGINETRCRNLQDNVVLCEDDFYAVKNGDPMFCRIVVQHKGYNTVTDKFRCEKIYYPNGFDGRKGK